MRISDWSSDVCSSDLELLELTSEHLRFPICDVKIVEHNQRAIFGFGGQSHFQAKRTHLLVQRRIEVTNTRTMRSEEHTSELQSLMRISYAVFCLNKKTKNNTSQHNRTTLILSLK